MKNLVVFLLLALPLLGQEHPLKTIEGYCTGPVSIPSYSRTAYFAGVCEVTGSAGSLRITSTLAGPVNGFYGPTMMTIKFRDDDPAVYKAAQPVLYVMFDNWMGFTVIPSTAEDREGLIRLVAEINGDRQAVVEERAVRVYARVDQDGRLVCNVRGEDLWFE